MRGGRAGALISGNFSWRLAEINPCQEGKGCHLSDSMPSLNTTVKNLCAARRFVQRVAAKVQEAMAYGKAIGPQISPMDADFQAEEWFHSCFVLFVNFVVSPGFDPCHAVSSVVKKWVAGPARAGQFAAARGESV